MKVTHPADVRGVALVRESLPGQEDVRGCSGGTVELHLLRQLAHWQRNFS